MIAAISLMQRRPDLTLAQFRRHWLDPHGVMTAGLPGVGHYVQSHPIDAPVTNALARTLAIDGIPELWFASYVDRKIAYTSSRIAECNIDSEQFVGRVTRLVTEPRVIVAPPALDKPVKVILIAVTTPDASVAKRGSAKTWGSEGASKNAPDAQWASEGARKNPFDIGWADRAEARVARQPGVVGYVRQHMLEQAAAPESKIAELQLAVAGVAEVYFESEAALARNSSILAGTGTDAERTAIYRVDDYRLV